MLRASGGTHPMTEEQHTDFECPSCGGAIAEMVCQRCGQEWASVFGVPFLGSYGPEDILFLIEVAAHVPKQENVRESPDTVRALDTLCSDYHEAEDKEMFRKDHPQAAAWWFPHRFSQWSEFEALTAALDLHGKKVLDIGAGGGFDSCRLHLKGALVTALEANPIVARTGALSFPSIRYVGGFAHAIPFKEASFDAVFINAALHHMHDIRDVIEESLRVLRPGGFLVTTGDPFRPDSFPASHELEVFDRHEEVLLGINEQIPAFSDYVSALVDAEEDLEIHVRTNVAYAQSPEVAGERVWNSSADFPAVSNSGGSIAMRAHLLRSLQAPRKVLRDPMIEPAWFARHLINQSEAVAFLAQFIPSQHVDAKFPGAPSKFELLNGWRLEGLTARSRGAFFRARWFLRRTSAKRVYFELRARTKSPFSILLNAEPQLKIEVGPEWQAVCVDVEALEVSKVFTLEIVRCQRSEAFDDNCFEVRNRNLSPNIFRHGLDRLRRALAGTSAGPAAGRAEE
jgi:ubiquinone/menaquinone biosynthesis C-methylase UbiE